MKELDVRQCLANYIGQETAKTAVDGVYIVVYTLVEGR